MRKDRNLSKHREIFSGMGNNMASENKKNSPVKRFKWVWRVLAMLLIIVMVVELAASAKTKVTFSPEAYKDDPTASMAANLLGSDLDYLSKNRLGRNSVYLRSLAKQDTYEYYEANASIAIGQELYSEAAEYMQGCIDTYVPPKELSEAEVSANRSLLYLKKASLLILGENANDAMTELNRSIAEDPKQSIAYYLRVQLRMDANDMDGAAKDALAYESLEKADKDSLSVFAPLYLNTGHYAEAERAYKELQALSTEHSDADAKLRLECMLGIGRSQLMRDDTDAALESLEQYILAGGTDEDGTVKQLLMACYLEQKKWEEATICYEELMKQDYEPASDVRFWIANAYLGMGDAQSALRELTELRNAEPNYTGAAYYTAVASFALEDYEKAKEAFTESIEASYETQSSYYYRAVCELSGKGSIDEAKVRGDLQKVIEIGGNEELNHSAEEMLGLMK